MCIKDHINHDVYHKSQIEDINSDFINNEIQSLDVINNTFKNLENKLEKLMFKYKSREEEYEDYLYQMVTNFFSIAQRKILSHLKANECIKQFSELFDNFFLRQNQEYSTSTNRSPNRINTQKNIINHQKSNEIKLNLNNEKLMKTSENSTDYLQMKNKHNEYLVNYESYFSKLKECHTRSEQFFSEIIELIQKYEFCPIKEQDNILNIGQYSSMIYFDYDNDENLIYICNLEPLSLRKAHINLPLDLFSTFCQSQEQLYLLGGIDKFTRKELNSNYKYENQITSKLSPMLSNKRDHSAISIQNKSIIIAGGFRSKNVISECEEYLIDQDKWITLPFLNEKKHLVSLCLIEEWIYTIGGIFGYIGVKGNKIESSITNYFERLNLNSKNGRWDICKPTFLNSEISLKGLTLSSAFSANKNEFFIFGGSDLEIGDKKQILIYNSKFNEINKMDQELVKEDYFNQVISSPICYKGFVYNVGFKNDLHYISLHTNEVKIIPFIEWSKNESFISSNF